MLRLKAAAAGLRPTLLLLLLWSDPLCCKPTTCCYLGAASTTKALQQNKYESTGHRFSGSIECGFEWSLIIDSFHRVCEKMHENMSPMETRCWILDGRQWQMRSAKILWTEEEVQGGVSHCREAARRSAPLSPPRISSNTNPPEHPEYIDLSLHRQGDHRVQNTQNTEVSDILIISLL